MLFLLDIYICSWYNCSKLSLNITITFWNATFTFILLNSVCIYIFSIFKFLHWIIIKEQYLYWIFAASKLCCLHQFKQHIYHRVAILSIYCTQNKHFQAKKMLNIHNQVNQINKTVLKSNSFLYHKGNDTSALCENTLLICCWLEIQFSEVDINYCLS